MYWNVNFGFRAGVLLLWALTVAAQARPGEGVGLGSWVFSPYLDLSYTDDSNVYKQSADEVRDTFFEPELGLRFSSSAQTNAFSIRGNLFYSDRSYTDETEQNFNAYGDNVTLRYQPGRPFLLELSQSYRHLDDIDRHTADIETTHLSEEIVEDSNTLDTPRDIQRLGALVSRRMSDKLELGLSYRYASVDYDNEAQRNSSPGAMDVQRGLDLDGHILQFEGAWAFTDKTDATLLLRHGIQNQEGTDGSADLTTLRLGLRTQGADKLVCRLGGGVERYDRPSQLDEDPDVSFSFSVAADWFITEKLTFRCEGYNGTQFSSFYLGNALEFTSFWAGLGYRWKPSTTFSVRAIYREDDYLDPVVHQGQSIDRLDKRFEGHVRADYIAPGGFLQLYLKASYDDVDSNLDFVDYADTRLILGAILRY